MQGYKTLFTVEHWAKKRKEKKNDIYSKHIQQGHPRRHTPLLSHTHISEAPWCYLLFLSPRDNSEEKTSHWTSTLAVTTINCRKKCAHSRCVMTETVLLISSYLSHKPTTEITTANYLSSTLSLGFRQLNDSNCWPSSVKTLFSKSNKIDGRFLRGGFFRFTVVNMSHPLLIIWCCRPQSIPDSVTSTEKYTPLGAHFCL